MSIFHKVFRGLEIFKKYDDNPPMGTNDNCVNVVVVPWIINKEDHAALSYYGWWYDAIWDCWTINSKD